MRSRKSRVVKILSHFPFGGGPEILAVVGQFVLFLFPFLVGETHRTFLAERRIRQQVIESFTGIGDQRVIRRYRRAALNFPDVVQEGYFNQTGLEGGAKVCGHEVRPVTYTQDVL